MRFLFLMAVKVHVIFFKVVTPLPTSLRSILFCRQARSQSVSIEWLIYITSHSLCQYVNKRDVSLFLSTGLDPANSDIFTDKDNSIHNKRPVEPATILDHYIVAHVLKTRTVEPEKQPMLGNDSITRNNGVTVGSDVFCEVRADDI
jgi:hypothetical protein